MEMITEVVALVASLAGLLTAIISLVVGRRNKEAITRQAVDISALQQAAASVAAVFTINTPRNGDNIEVPVYDEMWGTFKGTIPQGYRLWVLAKESSNFFLMHPPTQVTNTMKRWNQTNVRLATPGRWELHVCIADRDASDWLEARARQNNWSGFPTLPAGAETVEYVVVNRI
ncbi:MAG: hypothetical protein FJ224_04705 [Lentisphaerae bacterium]|nr:hypothetical protein [Lentisphaerota bacterium]